MAAVVTQVARTRIDKAYQAFTTIAFDSSYPTGGESITANSLGFGTILFAYSPGTYLGYCFQWDNANSKLLAYYGDNNNAADGPLIEVPNTTDLSSLVAIPLVIVGT